MAIPSGLASFLGAKRESVYGTYVAPDLYFEFDSESLTRQPTFLTSTGLRSGRMAAPISRHKQTTSTAGGGLTMKVPTKGFGRFLDLLHGNTVTPAQQAATIAYLQTHNIGLTAPSGKSLSMQIGKPDVAGTIQPFSYVGSKITQAGFSCDLGGELMANLTIDSRDEDTAQTLATPSYASGISSLDFVGGNVTIDGSQLAIISSANLQIPLPLKADRYGIGNGALKAEPIPNDYIRPTGSLTMEFNGLTAYNYFVNNTTASVVLDFQGAIIASTYKEQLKFTMAACHFTGTTPQVGGPDILTMELPFEVYDNGSVAPIVALYQSVDTTL